MLTISITTIIINVEEMMRRGGNGLPGGMEKRTNFMEQNREVKKGT